MARPESEPIFTQAFRLLEGASSNRETTIVEIGIFEVDWDSFLSTFPKAGDRAEVSDTQIDFDGHGYDIEAANVYGRLRGKLDLSCVKALDLLFSAVCINGVSKNLDSSSVYVPTVKYGSSWISVGSCE